ATDATIYASIQPLSDTEAQRYADLFRAGASHKAYTTDSLEPVSDSAGTPADEVIDGSETFRVVGIDNHGSGAPMAHTKAILVRVSDPV
ncbi:MAG TPA: hypothetical protein VLB27_02470, partial [candidate division Zixibacteria bacterium]|nr:hypothetical protein [candidate division Zixibacteria bacterium]